MILPEDGRRVYFEAFAAARKEIRNEICVLEDPFILRSLQEDSSVALCPGYVDNGKYESTPEERKPRHLPNWGWWTVTSRNPIFPRSFPKVIPIDDRYVLISTAC